MTPSEDGQTVGHVCRVSLHLTAHAVSRAKFVPDGILVDGRRAYTGEPLRAGQLLSVVVGDTASALEDSRVVPKAGPLRIVFEDDELVVVDKPAGLVTHPGPGHFDDTLANRLVAHFRAEGRPANFHATQRLDAGTSGLVVVAKNAHAQDRLQRLLHTQGFERTYLGVAEESCLPDAAEAAGGTRGRLVGRLEVGQGGVVDAPVGPVAGALDTYAVTPEGKRARTVYEVVAAGEGCRCLRLVLETGRTHQIRVHLASVGHPLVGDVRYGRASSRIGRPALHAARVSFLHPVTDRRLEFVSELPGDMRALLPQVSAGVRELLG